MMLREISSFPMSPCVHGFPLLHFGGLLDLEQYLGKGVSEAG